jgi:hypothetical protein
MPQQKSDVCTSLSPETTPYRKTPGIPVEVMAFAPKAIAARLSEEFPDVLQ